MLDAAFPLPDLELKARIPKSAPRLGNRVFGASDLARLVARGIALPKTDGEATSARGTNGIKLRGPACFAGMTNPFAERIPKARPSADWP